MPTPINYFSIDMDDNSAYKGYGNSVPDIYGPTDLKYPTPHMVCIVYGSLMARDDAEPFGRDYNPRETVYFKHTLIRGNLAPSTPTSDFYWDFEVLSQPVSTYFFAQQTYAFSLPAVQDSSAVGSNPVEFVANENKYKFYISATAATYASTRIKITVTGTYLLI